MTTTRTNLATCALLAWALLPMRASAQSVLWGTVAGVQARRLLRGAHVTIDSLALRVRTDSTGSFRLAGIPAGTHVVSVQHPGYAILDTALSFTGQDTLATSFILENASDTLDATDIKMAEFERHRAKGLGWFLTRSDLGDMYDRPLSEVLAHRIPGVALNRNARGTGVAVASARGFGSERQDSSGDGYAPACYAQVYVDGVRIFAAGLGMTPVNIDDWRTIDIEGIEYYPAAQQTPPEYAGAGALCGTISIWLRVS